MHSWTHQKTVEQKQPESSLSQDRRSFLGASGATLLISSLSASTLAAVPTPATVLVPQMAAEYATMLQAAAPDFQFLFYRDRKELIERASEAMVIYGNVDNDVAQAARSLRWIQANSAGVDSLLAVPALSRSDIAITDMRGSFANPVSDHAIAMLLALTRALPQLAAGQIDQRWTPDALPPMVELNGRTMLIVGLGGNGRAIAARAKAFGMKVWATEARPSEKPPFVDRLESASTFSELLPEVDVVVSAVPLTSQTRGLISRQAIAAIRPGGYIINVSRGAVVDGDAVALALESGQLAGAGLDVFDPEPIPSSHPIWKAPNCIITPHVAQQSRANEGRMMAIFAENLKRFAHGDVLHNLVDRRLGY